MNSKLKGIRGAPAFLLLTVLAVAFASAASDGLVYRVSISGTIDLALAPFVARVVKEAERDKADLIVFDINTLGGRLEKALGLLSSILSITFALTAPCCVNVRRASISLAVSACP